MYCTSCGRQLADAARFCPYCGTRVAGPATRVTGAPPDSREGAATHDPAPTYGTSAPGASSRYGTSPGAAPSYGASPYGPAPAYGTAPGGAAPVSPTTPAVLTPKHFLTWLLAVVGVTAAFLAVEYATAYAFIFGAYALGVETFSGNLEGIYGICIQLACVALALPWYRHVRARALGATRPRHAASPERVVALVLICVGMYLVVVIVVTVALTFFPEVEEEYSEMMDDSETFWLLNVISSSVLAPLCEEPAFRGVAMQFALRAVCPAWNKNLSADERGRIRVTPAQFWVANALQAAIFGVAHLNITQGLYTFICGLIFGWVWWRGGSLWWSIVLHAGFNTMSYAADFLIDLCCATPLGDFGVIVWPVVALVAGLVIFRGATEPQQQPQRAR